MMYAVSVERCDADEAGALRFVSADNADDAVKQAIVSSGLSGRLFVHVGVLAAYQVQATLRTDVDVHKIVGMSTR